MTSLIPKNYIKFIFTRFGNSRSISHVEAGQLTLDKVYICRCEIFVLVYFCISQMLGVFLIIVILYIRKGWVIFRSVIPEPCQTRETDLRLWQHGELIMEFMIL